MPFVSIDKRGVVVASSSKPFFSDGKPAVYVNMDSTDIVGRQTMVRKDKIRLAVVANWGQNCGIATYTEYLVDGLRPLVDDLTIFAEEGIEPSDGVIPCWRRGTPMLTLLRRLEEYRPDFVLVQHEFGIFPRATYLLQLLGGLTKWPYAVVTHSTYEHKDKSICTSAMRDIIVHTESARDVLRSLGNTSQVHVIPHGCVVFEERAPLWNIYKTDHIIVQFGFGFFYKGVDRAIEAVAELKRMNPAKYVDGDNPIFYVYYCSTNDNCNNIHQEYIDFLNKKVEDLDVRENVAIVRGYNSDETLNTILRTAKLAIFPYVVDPANSVKGASGALRIAMSNGIPVIASESGLFDSIPDLPRPTTSGELAEVIDKVFSDGQYKQGLIQSQDRYVEANTWDTTAERYLKAIDEIRSRGTVQI